jgi:hypothetical protein
MGKIYCPNCGFKNEFTARRPLFCSSCGTPFGKGPSTAPNANPQSFADESSSDSTHVPRIRNLEYEVEYEKNKYKGSDLIDS